MVAVKDRVGEKLITLITKGPNSQLVKSRVPNELAVERNCHGCEQNVENRSQVLASEEWPGSRKCSWASRFADLGTCSRDSLGAAHFVYRLYIAGDSPLGPRFFKKWTCPKEIRSS